MGFKDGHDNEELQYNAFRVRLTDTFTLLFHTHKYECPECKSNHIELDKQYNIVCRTCGLVLTGTYPYAAGEPIIYPYGTTI